MSEYYERLKELEDGKCNNCSGSGKCNDAEPGDIGYNEWKCPKCNGSGLSKGKSDE